MTADLGHEKISILPLCVPRILGSELLGSKLGLVYLFGFPGSLAGSPMGSAIIDPVRDTGYTTSVLDSSYLVSNPGLELLGDFRTHGERLSWPSCLFYRAGIIWGSMYAACALCAGVSRMMKDRRALAIV
jgi:hypothetical protein